MLRIDFGKAEVRLWIALQSIFIAMMLIPHYMLLQLSIIVIIFDTKATVSFSFNGLEFYQNVSVKQAELSLDLIYKVNILIFMWQTLTYSPSVTWVFISKRQLYKLVHKKN